MWKCAFNWYLKVSFLNKDQQVSVYKGVNLPEMLMGIGIVLSWLKN